MRLALALLLSVLTAGAALGADSGKTDRRPASSAATAPSEAEADGAVAAGPFGGELQGFDYPFPVKDFAFASQGLDLHMAYLDVLPSGKPNGQTAVLLHGKNFCAATWEAAIGALSKAGFRVVAPDQIGFCKSTKPKGYQFSFNQLALNTHQLLESLGIRRASVIGHSMGGMLAARFALAFPETVDRLVLVNPLGLEDWQAKGVPYQPIDAAYAEELKTGADSIRAYQRKFYYGGNWKPAYDRWVAMLAGLYAGPDREAVAWNQAQTSDMIFTQPVVREFSRIEVPTTLLIGQLDRTAPGAARAPQEIAAMLGDYPKLGKAAAALIPGAKLVEFPDLGHAPQIQAPEKFDAALLKALGTRGE
ncbi:hydrolase [Aureimonas endophytica]|uniref:Hydrolase n=1 Tax=Aureimonas endophytica TaxID=2027858 RepID=A0A916ZTZ0_9HYPH|nr:alpha/beta hydrolase [Aureimonas endophytica]GGE14054.1 hydrolase [Aureimonas endophytica]